MNDLVISNKQGESITTSLIIAETFLKNHSDVLRDIRNLHCSITFKESNFALLVDMKQLPQGGASKAEYYEISKDGFSFLVMGYTGEKAGQFKETFIAQFNKRDALLKNDDYIMVRAFEIQQNRIKSLEAQSKLLESCNIENVKQLREQAPKVLFADSVAASNQTILIADMAKLLKQNGAEVGQNRLFQWMRTHGYLLSAGSYHNRPSQRSMEMGLFKVDEWVGNKPTGEIITNFTVRVTGKGQQYFINKFINKSLVIA